MNETPPPEQFPGRPDHRTPDTQPPNYTPQQFRPTSALAVWSLVNGILGWMLCPILCSMIAVVTGHMAMGEIERLQLDGKGIAIAGLILGYSMLAVGLISAIGIAILIVFGLSF